MMVSTEGKKDEQFESPSSAGSSQKREQSCLFIHLSRRGVQRLRLQSCHQKTESHSIIEQSCLVNTITFCSAFQGIVKLFSRVTAPLPLALAVQDSYNFPTSLTTVITIIIIITIVVVVVVVILVVLSSISLWF